MEHSHACVRPTVCLLPPRRRVLPCRVVCRRPLQTRRGARQPSPITRTWLTRVPRASPLPARSTVPALFPSHVSPTARTPRCKCALAFSVARSLRSSPHHPLALVPLNSTTTPRSITVPPVTPPTVFRPRRLCRANAPPLPSRAAPTDSFSMYKRALLCHAPAPYPPCRTPPRSVPVRRLAQAALTPATTATRPRRTTRSVFAKLTALTPTVTLLATLRRVVHPPQTSHMSNALARVTS